MKDADDYRRESMSRAKDEQSRSLIQARGVALLRWLDGRRDGVTRRAAQAELSAIDSKLRQMGIEP